jgi:hypothetical protein
LSSHGSSCIGGRNREAVVCCYLVQTILTSVSYFLCKAALLNLASPWLGPCLSAKRPFDRAILMPKLLSLPQSPYLQGCLAEPCSPPSFWGRAFSAQRTFIRPCSCQSFFSVYLITGLPQLVMLTTCKRHPQRVIKRVREVPKMSFIT